MIAAGALRARRHESPAGWDPAAFEAVTAALAAALMASYRRQEDDDGETEA